MTAPRYQLKPGSPATTADLRSAQERDQLLRTELVRVREAATAWRNALGTLLAGAVGFGLIKGRSDVRDLATGWAAATGLLLLAALGAGTVGALLLIRAAHGQPTVVDVGRMPSRRAGDHVEALASAAALRRGIAGTLVFALLLITAVGATWYGPTSSKPALRVTTPIGSFCGSAVRLDHGTLQLKTNAGEVSADLTTASTLAAVDKCV